jgi:hypothetical protein
MRVEGEADLLSQELFPHGLVPQILRLIVDTWGSFQRPDQDEDEPKITNRFVGALEVERRRRGARFRIMPHVKDLERLDPESGKGFVEIDVYVPHGFDSRCYFGIEAKKLNTITSGGKWESQAGDYAGKEGMGCFIDGRYACYQCEGAMVGYVMDGDCDSAKSSISKCIEKGADALRVPVPCPLNLAQDLEGYPHAFESRHKLDRGEFTIYHVLLAAA